MNTGSEKPKQEEYEKWSVLVSFCLNKENDIEILHFSETAV